MISIYVAILFFGVAALYASIGFGGGSTYIAILALIGLSYEAIPVIALLCNIIVVTGGSYRFLMQGLVPWRRIWPLLLFSIPAAWLGGLTPISREYFMLTLGGLLILAAFMLLWRSYLAQKISVSEDRVNSVHHNMILSALLGMMIGYISGLIGIGGGIFLAPLLLLIQWDSPRRIAACASIFILCNSIAGLFGQFGKYDGLFVNEVIASHISLFVAVFVGGQIGSYLAVRVLPERIITILTALLTLYVGIRILWFTL